MGVDLIQPGPTRYNGHLPILGPHYRFQQQQMGGPVLKYEEKAAVVGYGGIVFGDDGRNYAVMGDGVQGGGTDVVDIR